MRVAARAATWGPLSMYAPVSRWISASRAMIAPSCVTPVFRRMAALCRRTVTMASGADRHTRTGRPTLREAATARGSILA